MEFLDGNLCPGGDKIDARGSNDNHRDSSNDALPLLSTEIDADEYNMNHPKRGRLLVFNHKVFDSKLGMKPRAGTDVDRDKVTAVFKQMGFKVDVHNDLNFFELRDKLTKASTDDYSGSDCFACVVLTHGEEGMLYSKDIKYRSQEIWTPFLGTKCSSLVGKPKMFFIQACQGSDIDDGVLALSRLTYDSHQVLKIPAHADFLIAYSTVPGYYSWRNTVEGSWFIQGLCKVFSRYYETTDVLSMMTKVNHFVAYNYISNTPSDPDMHQKKQIPCVSSMLTRQVFLRQK